MSKDTILPTFEEFEAFEEVRVSGSTNMCMTSVVADFSGLSQDTVRAVRKNYTELTAMYEV